MLGNLATQGLGLPFTGHPKPCGAAVAGHSHPETVSGFDNTSWRYSATDTASILFRRPVTLVLHAYSGRTKFYFLVQEPLAGRSSPKCSRRVVPSYSSRSTPSPRSGGATVSLKTSNPCGRYPGEMM